MLTYSTRQIEIIQSAGKIITEDGLENLTTKRISKEMNFSESAIYRHFSGKDEIIMSMLDYLADDMNDRFSTHLSKIISPKEKLQFIFINQIEFFIERPEFVGVIFPENLMKKSSEINQGIIKIMNVRKKHLNSVLSECQASGIIRNDLSIDEIAHIMMGSFRLLTLKWRLLDFEFDIVKEGKKLITNLFKIIEL